MIAFLSSSCLEFWKNSILQKHDIPVEFRPSNTLGQQPVDPKDNTPRHKQSNVVYAVQCQKEMP